MTTVLVKSLNRLSRSNLITLALKWLEEHQVCQPYLITNRSLSECDEEDYLYTPADNIQTLREIYSLLKQDAKENTKQDIVDRLVDGDWRRGLSLHQLAMIDFAYLEQNDTSLRWSALKLVPREESDNKFERSSGAQKTKRRKLTHHECSYPHIVPTTFVTALKSEISPLVKAHYHLHRLPSPYNLAILRLYISPKSSFAPNRSSHPRNIKQATDSGRVIYIALPDSCPYIYISLCGSSGSNHRHSPKDAKGRIAAKVDMAAMKRIILEAIPKAISRPQERWSLESTSLTTKSLRSICELRGNGKPGTSGGLYETFSEDNKYSFDINPVDIHIQERKVLEDTENRLCERFGTMEGQHHASLDRFHVKLQDLIEPDQENPTGRMEDSAPVTLTFSGTDVFLGLKNLAKLGPDYIDLDRLPTWMTGEMNVSSLTV